MATPKVTDNPKLFERVCYMLKLEVTTFQLPTQLYFFNVGPDKIAKKTKTISAITVCRFFETTLYLKHIIKW